MPIDPLGFALLTTGALHWFTKPYVHALAYDAASGAVQVTGLGLLGAVYGAGYQRGGDEKKLGVGWFNYNLLLASMVTVVTARNAILFLIAWEVMALSSFFLVTHEHDKPHVRTAGWIYMVATHWARRFCWRCL